jgi:hypothetical protein
MLPLLCILINAKIFFPKYKGPQWNNLFLRALKNILSNTSLIGVVSWSRFLYKKSSIVNIILTTEINQVPQCVRKMDLRTAWITCCNVATETTQEE